MGVVLVAGWVANEGEEERVFGLLAELASQSRAEPGCLQYQPHRSRDDPNVIFLYEQYADEPAFQVHADSEHFKRYAVGECFPRCESRDRAVYETFEP